jgi:hypothetical protein
MNSLDQDAIISSLKPDTEILNWLKKNKNKLKTEEDVVKFLDEYNKQ